MRQVLFVAVTLLLMPRPVAAQLSLGVSPLRVELAVGPGDTKTDVITVQNLSTKAVRMHVTIADWYFAPDGTPTFVKRGNLPAFSMSDWIEVNPTEFEVPGLGAVPLRYTVTVPLGVREAGYRAAILIESVPDTGDGPRPNVTYLNARIGVVVYDRIGKVPINVEIASQEVAPDPERPGHSVLRLMLKNAGLAEVRVTGEVHVTSRQAGAPQVVPFPEVVILPQSERHVSVPLEASLPPDGFTVLTHLDVGLPELLEAETRVGSPSTQ